MQSALSVKSKIDNGTYRLEDIRKVFAESKRKFMSPAWNTFLAIVDDSDVPMGTYVCCKFCKHVLKCTVTVTNNGKDAGTSNLLRHIKNCGAKVTLMSKKKRKCFWL
jgi:hypothetical protein